jgi:hypothetical protein
VTWKAQSSGHEKNFEEKEFLPGTHIVTRVRLTTKRSPIVASKKPGLLTPVIPKIPIRASVHDVDAAKSFLIHGERRDSSNRPTYRVFPDRSVHNHPVLGQAGRRFILCSCDSSEERKPHCETREKSKDEGRTSCANGACNCGA